MRRSGAWRIRPVTGSSVFAVLFLVCAWFFTVLFLTSGQSFKVLFLTTNFLLSLITGCGSYTGLSVGMGRNWLLGASATGCVDLTRDLCAGVTLTGGGGVVWDIVGSAGAKLGVCRFIGLGGDRNG